MAQIRSRDTGPEMTLRQFLHHAGLRYRIHAKTLPGKPDLVFRKAATAVFVQGCFWHGCRRCVDGKRRVKSNADYWNTKVQRNRARDAHNVRELRKLGFLVILVHECELTHYRMAQIAERIRGRTRTVRNHKGRRVGEVKGVH